MFYCCDRGQPTAGPRKLKRIFPIMSGLKDGAMAKPQRCLAPVAHQSALLLLPIALFLGCALVLQLFAFGDANQYFSTAFVIKVNLQRHQSHAFAAYIFEQVSQLFFADKQLAPPPLFVLKGFGLLVFWHVGVDQPQLTIFDIGIAFGDIHATCPHGLYFGAFEHQPTLDSVLNGIIIARLAVFRDVLVIRVFFAFRCHEVDVVIGGRIVQMAMAV